MFTFTYIDSADTSRVRVNTAGPDMMEVATWPLAIPKYCIGDPAVPPMW